MSSQNASRPIALLLALIPGWGHVYLGRERAGFALFTAAAFGWFLYANVALSYRGAHEALYGRSSLALALFFTIYSVLDVLRRTSPQRLRLLEEEKLRLLKDGMLSYLRGDLGGAIERLRRSLKLDAADVEAQFRLGVILARQGKRDEARAELRRSRALDIDGKWSWEIERELKLLAAGGFPPVLEAAASVGGTGEKP